MKLSVALLTLLAFSSCAPFAGSAPSLPAPKSDVQRSPRAYSPINLRVAMAPSIFAKLPLQWPNPRRRLYFNFRAAFVGAKPGYIFYDQIVRQKSRCTALASVVVCRFGLVNRSQIQGQRASARLEATHQRVIGSACVTSVAVPLGRKDWTITLMPSANGECRFTGERSLNLRA